MTVIDPVIIMREIMERDAPLFKALARPEIIHCTKCDHEWIVGHGETCDWCGAEGKELAKKT